MNTNSATEKSPSSGLLTIYNARAIPMERIPWFSESEFRQLVIGAPANGQRVVALLGKPAENTTDIFAILAMDDEGTLQVGRTRVEGSSYPSMTPECPQVHLFEREIAEQWGLVPIGHPWLKPVRYHQSYRQPTTGFDHAKENRPLVGVTDFYRVEGEEIHEVAVGPVHAGVIEPGHFRFQCHGEQVFHLEISLGYQHRGIERALQGGPNKRAIYYLETTAGDTTIGHASAYCQALECLSESRVSARAQALRAIALELERMANHTGDLGALAGDIGFLPTSSFCGRLRGDYLNITAHLCGSRFGRGMVRPGGVRFDVNSERILQILQRLETTFRDTQGAVELLWKTASVQARFEDTGRISSKTATELGLVGVPARACGLMRDVRKNHPAGIYQFTHIPISTLQSGDVFARAYLRWLEIKRAALFIRDQLKELPAGPIQVHCGALKPNKFCVSMVEGWRGEISHIAITDQQGCLASYKIIDASFHNWTGLAMALRNQQISDFPLCNKSFNLSYCGHDL
jgi:Ni,Fe-hydrogenase III large subunit